jgi:hypothetical protein
MLLASFSGCGSSRTQIKATSPNTEVVEAEGAAPVIDGDIVGAKKASLHDAMKTALGLVIGVYVSQESLVTKAVLIEDNISSQSEGYIEKYDVLKEWQEGDFYKTRITALVRKEDLSAKLKALELEPKKLGNPVVRITLDEFVDGKQSDAGFAAGELKSRLNARGFLVSDSESSDLQITGRADANFNTAAGLGGLVSYRASVSAKAVKTESKDVVASVMEAAGGVDVTRETAAKVSLVNCARKAALDVADGVVKYLKERSTVQLTLLNVPNINRLNDFNRSLRAMIEVRDCFVRNYAGGTAVLNLDMKKGGAQDVARHLETNSGFKLKIKKVGVYEIEAEFE